MPNDQHDHDHDHEHPGTTPDVDETERYQLMTTALKELLIEKGLIDAEVVRRGIEFLDAQEEGDGGKIIARAWSDPDFKARLLEDGTAAVAEMGFPMGDAELIVVENTDEVHNLLVCTLCSCYPRTILGLPPDWYKSKSYRARAVIEPRSVLEEFGTDVPKEKAVRVHDSNADMRYLVLPQRPEGTEGWSEEQLAAIVTRDTMVGVTTPQAD